MHPLLQFSYDRGSGRDGSEGHRTPGTARGHAQLHTGRRVCTNQPDDVILKLIHFIFGRCGSGLSGEALSEEGHYWVGIDISRSMLGQQKFLCTLLNFLCDDNAVPN